MLNAANQGADGYPTGLSETLQSSSSNPSRSGFSGTKDDALSASEIGVVLAIVALLGSFAVNQLAKQFSRWVFWKTLRDRLAHTKPRPLPQLPCTNCRFFNQNPYLKCTVHPERALTREALHCSDYWSNQSDRFSR